MRLFLAIELSQAVRDALRQAALHWPPPVQRDFSLTRPENLHVTLKFLGEVEEMRIKEIRDALGEIPKVGPMGLAMDRIVFFPHRGPVRIIGAEAEQPPLTLLELHERVEQWCQQLGFSPEARAYCPHVTLARARRPARPEHHILNRLNCPLLSISEWVLVRSELRRDGARYTVMARFAC